MLIALFLSGFFVEQRRWIKWLSVLFILPWAVPSIPTILSVRFMLNPEWGMVNQLIFKLTGDDGPNWLNDPTVALAMAIGVHIWKSLPFWTLILVTGRLAISHDLFEAADVDGATWWQKFRFITWPSMQTLYITCTLLSMIWTLGDFNSVYLLTGGGPADLTHVLSTLGIRYLRLDQLSARDGLDRLRAAVRGSADVFHDETVVAMRMPTLREAGNEARLLLIGIPVFIWTMVPIYHMFLFAISPKEDAFSGKLWPDHPTLHNFEIVFRTAALFPARLLHPVLEFAGHRRRGRRADAVRSRPPRRSRSRGCACRAAAS